MNNLIVINVLRFLAIFIIQVLVLKDVKPFGNLAFIIYPLAIILLTFKIQHWILMIIGFFLGLVIDIFYDTPGVNCFATTFMAFMRPYVCKIIEPRGGYDSTLSPNKNNYGIDWFARYSLAMMSLHVFSFYMVTFFSLGKMGELLLQAFVTLVMSYLIILLTQYIFNPKT